MQKKRLKISVCIVTYNHAAYIHDCLSSVVAQYVDADLEILVGDDCSSDDTRLIISKFSKMYPDIIFPVFHEKNIGGCKNYQYLVNVAKGDYIVHLDGDDFWLPGILQTQLTFLEKNLQCSAVYTNAIVVNNSGMSIAKFNGELPSQIDLDYLICKGNFLNASSNMYRSICKHLLLEIDGPYLDFHWHILLTSHGDLGYINKTLLVYRKNSTTSIIQSNRQMVLELYWRAIVCAGAIGAKREAFLRGIVHFYNELVFSALVRGEPKEIWWWGHKILKECPDASIFTLLLSFLWIPATILRQTLRIFATYLLKGGVRILHDR
jgi:glycosyltransferase involved in cell wall biosynthesis